MERLKQRRWPLIGFDQRPEYPSFLILTVLDPYAHELLVTAFDESGDGTSAFGHDVECLRRGRNRHGRNAVFRMENSVVQVTEAEPSRQSGSVLGRIGAVGILCKLLTEALGLPETEDVVIADLARLADRSETRAAEKRLTRLNNGEFVFEVEVKPYAKSVGISLEQLCFTHPTIWTKKAVKTRRAVRRNEQRNQGEVQRAALQFYRLQFARLEASDKDGILQFGKSLESAASVCYQPFNDTNEVNALERIRAIGNLVEAAEMVRNGESVKLTPEMLSKGQSGALATLAAALSELAKAKITAWVAMYEDRVVVDHEEEERQYWPELRARTVHKLVVHLPCAVQSRQNPQSTSGTRSASGQLSRRSSALCADDRFFSLV